MYNKKLQNGFSLIELLIVVVIIGIIAAIAIPNMLAARRSANEGSAISTLRLLYGAQRVYASSYGIGNYAGAVGAGTLQALSDLGARGLVDPVMAAGTKSGYNFVGGREALTPAAPAEFFFSGNPLSSSGLLNTGTRRFGVATEGVLKVDSTVSDLGIIYDLPTLNIAAPLNS